MPITDEDGDGPATWFQDLEEQQRMTGVSPVSSMRSRELAGNHITGSFLEMGSEEVIFAVQQPDGEKYAIARLCKDNKVNLEPHSAEGPSRFLDYVSLTAASGHGFDSDGSVLGDLKEPDFKKCKTAPSFPCIEEAKTHKETGRPEACLDDFSDGINGVASSSEEFIVPRSGTSDKKDEEHFMMEKHGQSVGGMERAVHENLPVEAFGSHTDDGAGELSPLSRQESNREAVQRVREPGEDSGRSEELGHREIVKCLMGELLQAAVNGVAS